MSLRLMNLVWPLQMPPPAKAVAVALADYADESGASWPAIAALSLRTCFSKRAVIDAIAWLERAHVVKADRTNGRHTRYLLTPEAFVKPVQQAHRCSRRTGAGDAPTGAGDAPDPCSRRTGPVRELHTNPQEPPRTVTEPPPVGDGSFEPPQDRPLAELLAEAREGIPLAAAAAVALRKQGVKVTSQDPNLLAAFEAGVRLPLLLELAELYPDKPIAYLCRAAVRMLTERTALTNGEINVRPDQRGERRESISERQVRLLRAHAEAGHLDGPVHAGEAVDAGQRVLAAPVDGRDG